MPLRIEGATVHIEDHCPAEDALPLHEFLLATPEARIVMADCQSLHAALAQVLLAARIPIEAGPRGALLRRCLHPLLPQDARNFPPGM